MLSLNSYDQLQILQVLGKSKLKNNEIKMKSFKLTMLCFSSRITKLITNCLNRDTQKVQYEEIKEKNFKSLGGQPCC